MSSFSDDRAAAQTAAAMPREQRITQHETSSVSLPVTSSDRKQVWQVSVLRVWSVWGCHMGTYMAAL